MTKITDVKCIRTRSNGTWGIVKIETNQPGLFGIGSASDHYHQGAVIEAIESMLGPKLKGRDASQIEDIWQTFYTSGYWRNGAITNTALGGIDMALWDIKGKEAGMPIYQLLGGSCRSAVPCYAHAGGNTLESLAEAVQEYLEDGFPVVRCQLGGYGGGGFIPSKDGNRPLNSQPINKIFDDEAYIEAIPQMFDYLRSKLGFGPKLTHDVHEHLRPQSAVALSKRLEPYRLFFLEDVLAPEQIQWFRQIREQCTTPQAMGELFVNPHEWLSLITERLIDYVRVRVSKAGGISPCRKIAALCESFGVNTAWQEGGDNDPVNQAAALHLDMASWCFGIQEENTFKPEEYDLLPGHAELKHGYMYLINNPGLGLDFDEDRAKQLLQTETLEPNYAAEDRRSDGSIVRP